MSTIELLAPGREPADSAAYHRLPHVLFVLDCFPKALGGGERVALRLASLLPSYGFRASILTLALPPQTAFRPELAPCPVYLLPLTSAFNPQAVRGAFALSGFLETQQVRLVQTFFESSDLWGGLVTRLSSDAKLIWSRRDMGILRTRKHSLAYRGLRNLPDAVFAVSHRVAEHVKQVDGVPAGRVHVVHNGLNLQHSSRNGKTAAPQSPVITAIGNIRYVKGHDVLLRAASQVVARFPNAVFSIAGEVLEPEFYHLLKSEAEARGLAANFLFLGHISNLHQHLEGASIFVLPSRSEGFSNALIEAMASGLPCVATDVGGNSEAIDDGVNGFIVPPENPNLIAKRILQLVEDPQLSARLGNAARHKVIAEFSSEAMVTKVVQRYRDLLTDSAS